MTHPRLRSTPHNVPPPHTNPLNITIGGSAKYTPKGKGKCRPFIGLSCAWGWPRTLSNIFFYLALIKQGRGFWAPEEESLVHNLINLPTDGSTYAALNGYQNPLICSVSVYYAKNGNCSRPSHTSKSAICLFLLEDIFTKSYSV